MYFNDIIKEEVNLQTKTSCDTYEVFVFFAIEHEVIYCGRAIAVQTGDIVEQGQVIGYVGDTGNSFGNHLHFEIYENGVRKDPLLFFRQE